MKSTTSIFRAWLNKTRTKAGLTYAQLASKSGVSAGAIHIIEQGDGCPSLDTAEKLTKALGGEIEIRSKPKHAARIEATSSSSASDPAADA